jgi:hypothetical protein
LSVDTGDSSK